MMTDLTAITAPLWLLDDATRKALREHDGPWEFLNLYGDWEELASPAWQPNSTYRVKPVPPKPREFWLHVEGGVSLPSGRARPSEDWVLCREVLP